MNRTTNRFSWMSSNTGNQAQHYVIVISTSHGSIKRDTHGSVLDETTATAVDLSILRGRNSNNRCCESDEGEKGLESHNWRVSG